MKLIDQTTVDDPEIGLIKLFRKSGVKRISIRASLKTGVTVTVPYLVSYDKGMEFVRSKKRWILNVLQKQKEKQGLLSGNGQYAFIENGTIVHTLLSKFTFVKDPSLLVIPGNLSVNVSTVVKYNGDLSDFSMTCSLERPIRDVDVHFRIVSGEEKADILSGLLKNYLVELVRKEAKYLFPIKLSSLAKKYDFSYHSLIIKHNSSNWGSCSTKRNINLNLNLMFVPDILCDYVILHELCHLKYMNHGESFHSLQEQLCKDHLMSLVEAGDEYALSISKEAAASASPVSDIMRLRLKSYPLI